jgi:predicted transcriptional regulator
MSTDVAVVGRNDDLSQVEDLMATKKLPHVPVLENDALVATVREL